MTELKSFKKYSWLISAIIAIIVGISAINIADLSFLPENIKVYVVGLIAICGILVKIIPENYRVNRAEEIVKEDLKDKVIINVDSESIVSQLQDYVDKKYGNWESIPEEEEPSHDDENIIEEIDPSQQYEEIIGDEDGC